VTFDVADVVPKVFVGVLYHADLSVPIDEVSKYKVRHARIRPNSQSCVCNLAEGRNMIVLTPDPSDPMGRSHQAVSLVPGDETWYWVAFFESST
jgi:hypothetical protein